MSICSLGGISVKFCRRAFILAHNSRVAVRTARVPLARGAHNSLYQMVKKRTLEARTKLQTKKFPNNQYCGAEPDPVPTPSKIVEKSNLPKVLPPAPRTPPTLPSPKANVTSKSTKEASKSPKLPKETPKCSIEPPIKCSKESPQPCQTPMPNPCQVPSPKPDKGTPQRPKICDNTQVLKAADCNINTRITGSGGGDPPGGPPGGEKDSQAGGVAGGKAEGDDGGKNTRMLLALLAALGAGGLLWWLLTRSKKDKDSCKDGAAGAALGGRQTVPASSAELPKHVPYLLIGGGTASFSAFRAIKANDPKAKVLMITNELRKPYMRPPLSKELWYSAQQGELSKDFRFKQWTGAERSLYFEPEEFFVAPNKLMDTANGGIAVAQGFNVKRIDPANHIVTLCDGYEISYDECLIATGCAPKNLNVFANAPASVKERVMVYRTPDDFERLKRYADEKKSITIIGNGFIGSELACSMANYAKDKDMKIYQIFQESGNMSKILPDYLSRWTTRKVESQGVCVMPKASVRSATRDESKLKLALSNGDYILTDVVVVCVGCEPNTSIANISGLEVDQTLGGFVVNAELEARRNLYAAGDASCFYDPLLGRRRVEHHDHSVVSGRLAGENMVGKKKPYAHQSMFWSDLGPEIGYEGIGLVDSSLPTVGIFALPTKADRQTDNLTETKAEVERFESSGKALPDVKPDQNDGEHYGRGVVFYLKDGKIVGILLWNLFNRIGLARTIINQNKKFDDLNEVAKLFEIHS